MGRENGSGLRNGKEWGVGKSRYTINGIFDNVVYETGAPKKGGNGSASKMPVQTI